MIQLISTTQIYAPALLQMDGQQWQNLRFGMQESILLTLSLLIVVAIALLTFVIYKLRTVPTQDTLKEELQNFRKDLNEDMDILRKDVRVQLSNKLPILFDPHAKRDEEEPG
jgi:hypothetical protein